MSASGGINIQPSFTRPFVTPKMPPRPIAQPQPITPNRYTRTRVRPINQPTGPIVRPTNPAITNPNVRIGPGLPAPIQRPPVAQPAPRNYGQDYENYVKQYQANRLPIDIAGGARQDAFNQWFKQQGYLTDKNRIDYSKLLGKNIPRDQYGYVGMDVINQGEALKQKLQEDFYNQYDKTNPYYKTEYDKMAQTGQFDALGIGQWAKQQGIDTGIDSDFTKSFDPYNNLNSPYWQQGIDWDTGIAYGLNGEINAGGRIVKPNPNGGGYIDVQTGENVYNAAPPSFVGRSQFNWKTLQPGQSAPTPSFGGGKSGVFGSAQPSPGGPYTPRPDLGPGVGFGPGLPQPQLEAMPYTDSTAPMQQSGMPGGKSNPIGNFIGSAASLIPNAIGNAAAQSQDPNAQRIAPLFTGLGGVMNQSFSNMGGKSGSAPNYQQTQATQQNPNVSIGMSGGFNPAAGNTTLPGNF